MTKKEIKEKVLRLIEEINPENKNLTDDPDLAAKHDDVINQVMHELVRMKKLPGYVEIPVVEGQVVTYADIEKESGSKVYQLCMVRGAEHSRRADNTILKVHEDGVLEIEFYRYPKPITADTPDDYEFELTQDALEIMPYGVAADLLKSDVSANYGQIYQQRYETMLQRLDPRYGLPGITIEGGYNI